MTLSEADRHALHDHFISQMGEHLAGQLMRELVHGVEWGELATKENVVATREILRTEMAELRAELRAEMAELRADMAELRAEMRTEIAGLRSEMHRSLRRMTVWMASLQTATFGAIAALAIRGG